MTRMEQITVLVLEEAIERMEKAGESYSAHNAHGSGFIHNVLSVVDEKAYYLAFPERCPTDFEDQLQMMKRHLAEAKAGEA